AAAIEPAPTAAAVEPTATAATAKASATPAATKPSATAYQHERRLCFLRRHGGDIARHAAVPGGRARGPLGSHQHDQSERRRVKQGPRHHRDLTWAIWT